MKYYSPYWFLFFFIFSFLVSCSNESPIEEEKFVKIYTDILILQDTTFTSSDSLKIFKEEIFSRYGIDSLAYSNTINYYNKEPERWEGFFNKVLLHIDSLTAVYSKKDTSQERSVTLDK